MRLAGHGASNGSPHAGRHLRTSRGAWYPDPFGVGDERWWDGSQWTREVRTPAGAESVARSSERPATRGSLDVSRQAQKLPGRGSNPRQDRRFPVSIEAVVEEQLSVVSSTRKPGMHCQVLASHGRAGSISVFGGQMARLACAHGAWILKRSVRDRRGLTIESTDHKRAGSYLRRRWRPGGTIRLNDGTEIELRRSRPGRWKVQSAGDRKCLAEVQQRRRRSERAPELKVTVHSLPADASNASMVILAACALLMLPAVTD